MDTGGIQWGLVTAIGGFVLLAAIIVATIWTKRAKVRGEVTEQGTRELYDKLARDRESGEGSHTGVAD